MKQGGLRNFLTVRQKVKINEKGQLEMAAGGRE
jgi:hypothetical protein